jgi:hypothetical protein
MNWHWPSRPNNTYAPLYVMVWRLPWMVPIVLGRALIAVGVWGAYGSLSEGIRTWKEFP